MKRELEPPRLTRTEPRGISPEVADETTGGRTDRRLTSPDLTLQEGDSSGPKTRPFRRERGPMNSPHSPPVSWTGDVPDVPLPAGHFRFLGSTDGLAHRGDAPDLPADADGPASGDTQGGRTRRVSMVNAPVSEDANYCPPN